MGYGGLQLLDVWVAFVNWKVAARHYDHISGIENLFGRVVFLEDSEDMPPLVVEVRAQVQSLQVDTRTIQSSGVVWSQKQ